MANKSSFNDDLNSSGNVIVFFAPVFIVIRDGDAFFKEKKKNRGASC